MTGGGIFEAGGAVCAGTGAGRGATVASGAGGVGEGCVGTVFEVAGASEDAGGAVSELTSCAIAWNPNAITKAKIMVRIETPGSRYN